LSQTAAHNNATTTHEKLTALFENILDYFRSKKLSSINKTTLIDLPWYLVLGQPESGKHTFLAGYEEAFIFSKTDELTQNSLPSWWATKTAVFVHIPGEMLLHQQMTNDSWTHCIDLFKKYQKHCPIHGILLLMDSHDILTRSDVSNHFRYTQLAKKIALLRPILRPHTPIFCVLNKCDLIPGFLSFFTDQTKSYYQQIWGIECQEDTGYQSQTAEYIHKDFDLLIKQLNKQLLWKLHHEFTENKRLIIKSFPLQIEQLKTKVTDIILGINKQLPPQMIKISSIYLVSCKQYDIIDAALQTQLQSKIEGKNPTSQTQRRYFTHQILNRIASFSKASPVAQKQVWYRRKILPAYIGLCCLIITILIYSLGKDFSNQVNMLAKANTAVNYYHSIAKHSKNIDIETAINILNSISSAKAYTNYQAPLLSRLVFGNTQSTKELLDQTRQYVLYNVFVPAISNFLSQYLHSTDHNPAKLYIGLKIYLMLGNRIPMDLPYIQTHLKQLFSDNHDKLSISNNATNLLVSALKQNFHAIKANTTLIEDIRDQLLDTNASELAYIILFSDISHQDIDLNDILNTQKSVFDIPDTDQTIPAIYTAKEFNTVFPNAINAAVSAVTRGNDVLGQHSGKHTVSSQRLQKQVKSIYLKEYRNTWIHALNSISLKSMNSYGTLHQAATLLSSQESPLLTLLTLVQQNTQFPEILDQAPKLQAINQLLGNLTHPKESLLYQWFSQVKTLAKQTQNTPHQQKGESALLTVKTALTLLDANSNRDHETTTLFPAPLQAWLTQLNQNYLQLSLNQLIPYINDQWNQQIVSVFNTQIKPFFPFNSDAKTSVPLETFNHFFKASGTLEAFEKSYIFPFMHYSNGNWEIKPEIANLLLLSDQTLAQLKRLARIQAMYFSETKGQRAYAEFTLQPISTSSAIQSFKLTLGNETVMYHPNMPNAPTRLEWPSSTGDTITLDLIDDYGQHHTRVLKNPWDWPKLVNESAKIPPGLYDTNVDIDIQLDRYTVTLKLLNKGTLNPYALSFLQATHLPKQIFEIKK